MSSLTLQRHVSQRWSGGNYEKVCRNKPVQAVAQDGRFRHRISLSTRLQKIPVIEEYLMSGFVSMNRLKRMI